jgi:ribose/xylose/arabinose/galactoside ABC-type transport system permease subunit
MNEKSILLRRVLGVVPTAVWGLVIMGVIFTSLTPSFLTLSNIANVFRSGSILMILCMGVVVVKIIGGIDLSVGGVMTFAGMLMAWTLVNWQVPVPVAALVSLVIGAMGGFLNGFFVTRLNVPSFIATLGTQGMAIGLSLVLNNGNVIWGLPDAVKPIGHAEVVGVPVPMLVSVVAFLCSFFMLRFTPLGTYMYAVGGNEEALALSGKPVERYKVFAFAYAGLMSGLAAIVLTSRNMAAQPTVGLGMEFEAFAAVVLGGSFVAGRGSAIETVLGVLFILVLRNGLNVVGVPTFYQLAIIGVAIISGIISSTVLERTLD